MLQFLKTKSLQKQYFFVFCSISRPENLKEKKVQNYFLIEQNFFINKAWFFFSINFILFHNLFILPLPPRSQPLPSPFYSQMIKKILHSTNLRIFLSCFTNLRFCFVFYEFQARMLIKIFKIKKEKNCKTNNT